MNFFLRIKHWQFFLLAFIAPVVLQLIALFFLLKAPLLDSPVFTIFTGIMLLPLFMTVGWQYTLGVKLYPRLPFDHPMPLKRFKWFLFIPFIYIALISLVFVPFVLPPGGQPESAKGMMTWGFAALLIFPLHLFSMFCLFYTLYYVAQSLKAVESQRVVHFSDFAGEFFLAWFLPIGIWILQPRINKIFSEEPFDLHFSFMNDPKPDA